MREKKGDGERDRRVDRGERRGAGVKREQGAPRSPYKLDIVISLITNVIVYICYYYI
jgi:hypothetical protein